MVLVSFGKLELAAPMTPAGDILPARETGTL